MGKVYHNVLFPFKQKPTNGVAYWCFDSSETTLAMQKDSATGKYYLKDTENKDWAKNVEASGAVKNDSYGFFPFNETTGGSIATKYNFGFGTKLRLNFA